MSHKCHVTDHSSSRQGKNISLLYTGKALKKGSQIYMNNGCNVKQNNVMYSINISEYRCRKKKKVLYL